MDGLERMETEVLAIRESLDVIREDVRITRDLAANALAVGQEALAVGQQALAVGQQALAVATEARDDVRQLAVLVAGIGEIQRIQGRAIQALSESQTELKGQVASLGDRVDRMDLRLERLIRMYIDEFTNLHGRIQRVEQRG